MNPDAIPLKKLFDLYPQLQLRKKMARQFNITEAYVSQLLNGKRPFPPEMKTYLEQRFEVAGIPLDSVIFPDDLSSLLTGSSDRPVNNVVFAYLKKYGWSRELLQQGLSKSCTSYEIRAGLEGRCNTIRDFIVMAHISRIMSRPINEIPWQTETQRFHAQKMFEVNQQCNGDVEQLLSKIKDMNIDPDQLKDQELDPRFQGDDDKRRNS